MKDQKYLLIYLLHVRPYLDTIEYSNKTKSLTLEILYSDSMMPISTARHVLKAKRDIYKLKMKEGGKRFHENGNQKKARVAILTSVQKNVKIDMIQSDMKGKFIRDKTIIYTSTSEYTNIWS